MRLDPDTRRDGGRWFTVAWLAIAALLLARVPLLANRIFDPDELEHSHAAWSMFKGMLPYKDFFEHHTPWYYYVLRPLFNWFAVDASFDAARHFLIAGRALSFALTVLSLVLVYRIDRRWRDRRVGVVAALVLVSQPFFLQKTVELRPDVLALPLFLGGLALLLRGLDAAMDSRRTLRVFAAAGLCLGGAAMCTQKALFVFPGMLAGLGLWALTGGRAGPRIVAILGLLVGVAVPAALTWAAFASHHAGHEFITNNFLLNAHWKHFTTNQLVKLLETSGPVLALGLVGISGSFVRWFRDGARDHRDLVLACTVVGLFVGVLAVPAAHRQYYLMPLPIICLFAADGLLSLIERIRRPARFWLAGIATIGLAVLPIIAFVDAYQDGNGLQLARLRTVFQRTQPADLVMDGWEGLGVFRPHAFFYFFLHEETRAMLPASQWDGYLDALEAGRIRPALIVLDENLRALGPRFLAVVEARYATRDGLLYFAREP